MKYFFGSSKKKVNEEKKWKKIDQIFMISPFRRMFSKHIKSSLQKKTKKK